MADRLANAVDDYSQLKNAYPGLNKFLEMLGHNISQQVPAQEEYNDPNKMMKWATNSALNAPTLATIVKPNVFDEIVKHYGGPAGIIKKIFYNSDKSPKEVMIGDDAVNYYLDSIKHLEKFNKVVDGVDKTFYRNLDDGGNYYSGVYGKPDAEMWASFAGNSKGSGKFNDMITGMLLDNNNFHPSSITRKHIANEPTLNGFASGQPFDQTLLGKSSNRIADNLGGVLGGLSIKPSQYNTDLLNAVMYGVNPNDFNQMSEFYKNLPSIIKPRKFVDMYKDVDLTGPISYPGLENRPNIK